MFMRPKAEENMKDAPVIVWFRQDLRTRDQPALSAAAASGRPVLPLYVLDDESPADWRQGGAARWWLHGNLRALGNDLAQLGSPLVLRRGESAEVVASVARDACASAVATTRHFEPHWRAADERLRARLGIAGVTFEDHPGSTLFEPGAIRNRGGGLPKVFSPFWRACLAAPPPARPLPAPPMLRAPSRLTHSDRLDAWGLLPTRPDWAGGLRDQWTPGEAAAQQRLTNFVDRLLFRYHLDRNRPEPVASSQLSPHLHFGELSPREIWHMVSARMQAEPGLAPGGESWLREIGWREFSVHMLAANPRMPDKPLHPRFADFPWLDDTSALRAWQRGQTGYPIVDAGMRQLWHIGWIHNRVRMIVASFLIKHLLIPWQQGEAWFWDTLVDADLANNAAGWQWVAGCGIDATPYFRIFNPVLQGEKFDPGGNYVRRWVPELTPLQARHIHRPWEAAPGELAHAGVRLGVDYPQPMIDHATARARALQAFDSLPA
jgi:deoxyribodipyrimidine photo-lyase